MKHVTLSIRRISNPVSDRAAGSMLGGKMESTTTTGVTINDTTIHPGKRNQLPGYQKPNIRVMDEREVLSAFQVTVAGISWWV